jgi:hypothetical protein
MPLVNVHLTPYLVLAYSYLINNVQHKTDISFQNRLLNKVSQKGTAINKLSVYIYGRLKFPPCCQNRFLPQLSGLL